MIDGQFQHGVFIAQLRLPIRQLTRLLTGLQPAPLPQGIVAVLDRQVGQLRRHARFMGVVAADELVDQHIHRPAIGDDVVQGQQQHMFLFIEREQFDPQQRAAGQVEGPHRLCFGGPAHRLLAFGSRQGTEVLAPDRQCRAGGHLQEAVVGLALEHRAQGFMPGHQAGESLLQRRQAQRALEPHRSRQVVGATARLQLPEKPHALLGIGQGLAILGLDALGDGKTAELHALLVQRGQEHPALFQGQPDKPASKFQGVFSIHFWGIRNQWAQGTKASRPYKTNADRKN